MIEIKFKFNYIWIKRKNSKFNQTLNYWDANITKNFIYSMNLFSIGNLKIKKYK